MTKRNQLPWLCGDGTTHGCGYSNPSTAQVCECCGRNGPGTPQQKKMRYSRSRYPNRVKRPTGLEGLDLHQQACLMLMQRGSFHSEKHHLHGRQNQYDIYVCGGTGMSGTNSDNIRHSLGIHRYSPQSIDHTCGDDPLWETSDAEEMLAVIREDWGWTDVTEDAITTLLWSVVSGTGEATDPRKALTQLLKRMRPKEVMEAFQEVITQKM